MESSKTPETGGTWLRRVVLRLRSLFDRGALERELDDEMRDHVEREAAALVRQGMPDGTARLEAVRRFGGVERYKENCRDERGVRPVDELRQDVGYALRAFRRAPAFTLVVTLTLALGIGATTAVFTAVRGVLLRQLPFDEPDRLVHLWSSAPAKDYPRAWVSLPDFEDWRRQSSTMERMGAYAALGSGLVLQDGGEPTQLQTTYVTDDFFTTLGLRARLGRVILPAEHAPGANRVVLLTDLLWRTRFGGDANIVGRSARFNDEAFTIVGVLAPGVRFPEGAADLYTPLSVIPESGIPRIRPVRFLKVVGRLRPGVSVERAGVDMATVARRLEGEYKDSNDGWTAGVTALREDIVGASRTGLLILFGAALLVLVLACVNVATLFLARASTRERELAIRLALGAGRGRLVRQLLTESMLLSIIGGALGVTIAWWGSGALAALAEDFLPGDVSVRPDWMVLAFGAVLSTLTGLAFGLVPAARGQTMLGATLRSSGRGTTTGSSAQRLRSTFVCAQVALAVLLVAGGGLLVKSWSRLARTDLGFDAEHTVMARVTVPSSRYQTSEQYLPAATRILEQLRAAPGVISAGAIKDAPLRGSGEVYPFTIPGRAALTDVPIRASVLPITSDYFRTMGIPLLTGRDLIEQDGDSGSAGVVVSQRLARDYFPGQNPIGEMLTVAGRTVRIVGVVGDVRYTRVDSVSRPAMYVPQPLVTRRIFTFVARTAGDPAALLPAVREAIHAADTDQPIAELSTMSAVVSDAVAAPRFLTMLVALFALLAVVLAAIGIYGVVAYVVGWRTREIGIRVALGARSASVVRWALWSGLAPVMIGLGLGVVAAVASSRVLTTTLYEVSPTDPGVFVVVIGLLAAVSMLAAGIPALRAARVDPIIALRQD